jgi:hypothetical protein
MAEYRNPFIDNNNDTITDTSSGLIWQKQPDREAAMSWDDACAYVRSLTTGGHSSWRLPTRQELHDLALTAGENPTQWLCDHGFEGIEWEYYWSSTKHDKKEDHYWYVDLGTGETGIHSKNRLYFVWAVCRNDSK